MYVQDWMTINPVTVTEHTSVTEARGLLETHGVRGLPVMRGEGELIGIVTDRDLRESRTTLARLAGLSAESAQVIANCEVGLLMSPRPVTVNPTDTIVSAATLMQFHRIGGCPVVDDDGALAGVLTESDCLTVLTTLLRTAESQPTL